MITGMEVRVKINFSLGKFVSALRLKHCVMPKSGAEMR